MELNVRIYTNLCNGVLQSCCRGVIVLRSLMITVCLLGTQLKRFLPLILVLLMSSLGKGVSEREKLESLEGWRTLVDMLAATEPRELGAIANQAWAIILDFRPHWHLCTPFSGSLCIQALLPQVHGEHSPSQPMPTCVCMTLVAKVVHCHASLTAAAYDWAPSLI